MGIRASIYALDLEWINQIARMTLRDLLWLYSQQPCAANQNVDDWLWLETFDLSIYAKSGGVFLYKGEEPGELTRERAKQIEFLSQTVSDYMSRERAFALQALFRGFIKCDPVGTIRPIVLDSKLFWLDSILDIIAEIYGDSSDEYQRITDIFRKTMCGFESGEYTVSTDELVTKYEYQFPLKPPDDPEVCFGYWTGSEARFLANVLDSIPLDTVFKAPVEDWNTSEGIGKWNAMIWDAIGKLQTLKSLNHERWCVVTFYGQ